jgi:hypothetical protein
VFFSFAKSSFFTNVNTKVDGAEGEPVLAHPRASFLIVVGVGSAVELVGEEFVERPFDTEIESLEDFEFEAKREWKIERKKRGGAGVLKGIESKSKGDVGGEESRPKQGVHLPEGKEVKFLLQVSVDNGVFDGTTNVKHGALRLGGEVGVPIVAEIGSPTNAVRSEKGSVVIAHVESVTRLGTDFPRMLGESGEREEKEKKYVGEIFQS